MTTNVVGRQQPLNMDISVEQVQWKIQTWNHDPAKPQALYVPYFDARDVAQKLDDLFGWDGWSDDIAFAEVKGAPYALCRLTVYAHAADGNYTNAVVKCDAAPLTDREAIKGGASDAFKRAAAKLGVGRNAYSLPTYWASCDVRGEGDRAAPTIPRGHQEKLTKRALADLARGRSSYDPE